MATRLLSDDAVDWKDSLVLCAFPTTGSVSSIAAHYLQRKLDLPMIGSFVFDDHSPVAAVRKGRASAPVRLFGGEVACSLPEGKCPRLYLVVSDLPLMEDHVQPLAEAILDAAGDARMVICLDGVVRDEDDDIPDVFVAGSDAGVVTGLSLEGTEPLEDALLAGMTGELLLQGVVGRRSVGALIVETAQNLPDGRAAAALITVIDSLLPTVKVDAEPLLQEAMELEKQILNARRNAERQSPAPRLAPGSFI